ncbi:GT2 family glycosyltransferase [Actinocorallia herbida]|uniref:GT2 family glycosyltransferase n=1 Tax=Actinocorallia herbida TaxID=58109 RepID=A0A3N1CN59_9ACTN|nr:glycosyltransferase family 2 protein [Actinocorallia herbida]ROO82747.1 GT2 family glycosyltransferase [Actinocorallia herbida]
MSAPRVGVVIVSYNSADVLPDCLASLAGQDVVLTRVVVADNASADESLAVAETAGASAEADVKVLATGRNGGYAAGFNAGLRELDLTALDAVCVLNPDCRLRPGALGVLAAALLRPGIGIAAPRLVNPDGTLQPTLRRMPTVGRALAEAVLGGTFTGRHGTLGELITTPGPHEREGRHAWATGAALLMSAEALRAVGEWDESFLLYSEETEFILRAADRGFGLWYCPDSVVEHIGAASGTSPALAALSVVNRVLLFRRIRSRSAAFCYFLAVALGQGLRALAGHPDARAAFVALVRPSRRPTRLAGG